MARRHGAKELTHFSWRFVGYGSPREKAVYLGRFWTDFARGRLAEGVLFSNELTIRTAQSFDFREI